MDTVTKIGYVDPYNAFSQRVLFKNGTVGVVWREEKKDIKKLSLNDLYIDIGANSREEALKLISIGEFCVFDFDFCGNGWLCLDVAYYLMQLYVVEINEAEYRSKADAFLKGYESVCPLSAEETRLLPMLGACLYFFYLGVQCRRFDNFSNVFVSETYLKRYITHRVKRHFDFQKLGNQNVVQS